MTRARYEQRIAARPRMVVVQCGVWCGLRCTYCYLPDRHKRSKCMLAEAEFTASDLTEVVLDGCTLRHTEFGPGTYRDTDLRGSDLSTVRGAMNLKRAIIAPLQEAELAQALISGLDLTITDDPQ